MWFTLLGQTRAAHGPGPGHGNSHMGLVPGCTPAGIANRGVFHTGVPFPRGTLRPRPKVGGQGPTPYKGARVPYHSGKMVRRL